MKLSAFYFESNVYRYVCKWNLQAQAKKKRIHNIRDGETQTCDKDSGFFGNNIYISSQQWNNEQPKLALVHYFSINFASFIRKKNKNSRKRSMVFLQISCHLNCETPTKSLLLLLLLFKLIYSVIDFVFVSESNVFIVCTKIFGLQTAQFLLASRIKNIMKKNHAAQKNSNSNHFNSYFHSRTFLYFYSMTHTRGPSCISQNGFFIK